MFVKINSKIKIKKIMISILFILISYSMGFGSIQQDNTIDNQSIRVILRNSLVKKLISLTIFDESSGALIQNKGFTSLEGDGTDANGDFIRLIRNLSPSQKYTVILKIDTDGGAGEESTDMGQIITDISPGNSVQFDNLQSLRAVTPDVVQDQKLANQTSICLIANFNYFANDIHSLNNLAFADFMFVTFDSNGYAGPVKSAYLPSGIYNNILCYVDADQSNGLSSGDMYQIIEGENNLSTEGSKTFQFGKWLRY